MRIWSLHPSMLDAKGLVALWRETLLAQHVLLGKTKGYKNHPQLNRFKECVSPVQAISNYLWEIYKDAKKRGYDFDCSKISKKPKALKIKVTKGQVEYELAHLKKKLKKRSPEDLKRINKLIKTPVHPLFKIVAGDIESWEIL